MTFRSLEDPEFDRSIQLRDAYRVMQRFVEEYLSRGDGSISDFLHSYVGEVISGETTDPAALEDFLSVSKAVVSPPRDMPNV